MAENYYPKSGGAGVTDQVYERLMAPMTGDGLVGPATSPPLCYADSTGRQVKIRPTRAAILRGFYYTSGPDPAPVLPIAANGSGKPRIDRIVLQLDRNTYEIHAKAVTGTPSANPVPPPLVRQVAPDRYWQLNVATVAVPSGATGIPASAVTNLGYYLTEPMYAGPSAARPTTPSSGALYHSTDNGRVWIGTDTNAWRTLYYDSNWATATLAAGWKAAPAKLVMRRKSGWVYLGIDVIRTGGTVAKDAVSLLTTLPDTYRPDTTIFGTILCSSPDHVLHVKVTTAGKVTAEPNFNDVINKDSYLVGQVVYPMTES